MVRSVHPQPSTMRPYPLYLLALASLLAACSVVDGGAPEEESDEGPAEANLSVPLAKGKLEFRDACRPGDKLTISAVGDVLLHTPLQTQAYEQGYGSLWKGVQGLISRADISYANLEGPTARGVDAYGANVRDPGKVFDGRVYSSYPQFNYHASLTQGLVDLGIDVVSTANNHSLDRRGLGVDRTIEALRAQKLPYTGTRAKAESSAPWHTVTKKNGFSIGWLACAFGTNGIPDPGHQVLNCFSDTAELLSEVKTLKSKVDAVIVTPHWGEEYVYEPQASQKKLARQLLDAGALAVLGSHPHVVEPWEKYLTADGRETFVIYSLGNFVSGQTSAPRRASLVLYLGLTRGEDNVTRINGVRYVPLTMNKWKVQPSDVAEQSSETRAIVEKMYGKDNLLNSREPLATQPACR
jgi:hypothetical protein